jgi:hypothetical protein
MRHFSVRALALLIAAVLGWILHPSSSTSSPPALPSAFELSFVAGRRDDGGHFMGGTEMRVLADHGGKLFAGNGYWMDRPGPEGFQGAQILVLDAPSAGWRVDHTFDERMATGRPRHLAVSALREVRFTTDWQGARLPKPVSLLLASIWDLTGATRVFARDGTTGSWSPVTLAKDPTTPGFLPQIRSLGVHRDGVTGIELVFAGQDPRGIFSGSYDASLPGKVRWGSTPEFRLADVPTRGLSGANAGLRVSSFAECNGRLYAAIGQHIYERIDGPEPSWRLIYTNPRPGHSETGLRGLTPIPGPSGGGDVLLAAVEGNAARIVRVDPQNASEVTELDLVDFLGRTWGMRVGYVIAAYNDMTKLQASGDLLIGLEAFVPRGTPIAPGHNTVDVGYGVLERGGWYLIRHGDGRYELHQIAADGQALVAIRSIHASPFANDRDAVYFAGYDANKAPAHNTAWIIRSTRATAPGGQRRE